MRGYAKCIVAVVLLVCFLRPSGAGVQAAESGAWASAAIVCGDRATELERLAACELQRYLYRISGVVLPLSSEKAWKEQPTRPLILVGTVENNALISVLAADGRIKVERDALGEQGFAIKAFEFEGRPVLVIAAPEAVGVLYGAYAFLERMGVGFYLGGDTFPGHNLPPEIPADLSIQQKPVLAIRGSLPWYNFLNSPTTWDLDDFKYFFDQMSKMKNNFVGFHTYDSEPFAPYEEKGKLVRAGPLVTSQNYGWGTVRGLRTEEFGFGTGDYFDQEAFGSRATIESKDRDDAIRRAQALLAQGLNYARQRGIKVCVGFEVHGDPTQPESQVALEARLRELVRAYPMLDYVWLWEGESLGTRGADSPPVDSPLDVLVRKEGKHFDYLKDPRRIVEAVRMSEYIQLGHAILKRIAPNLRIIVSGWGGDKWMRFSDFCQGFDETLPPDVIFAGLDNINPAAEPNVSAVYGKLSPKRERWPIPWWESDGGPRRDQWCPQTNTKEFTFLCRDALAKGCQGLLAIHWRTRDVEEVAAYCAQFAWEPNLTYEEFYRRFSDKCFGKEYGEEMAAILRQLESLGPRWTGGGGQSECGQFTWLAGNQLPLEQNLKTLQQIRTRLTQIRKDMESKGRLEGMERISHLITTIDWVTLYDAAASKLCPSGQVPNLLVEAEKCKRRDDLEAAAKKAQEAWDALKSSGLREAMRTYSLKMTTRGEFGSLATINVKAFASYLELQERIWSLLPAPPAKGPEETPTARDLPLHVVLKTPPTLFSEKQAIPVRAIVIPPDAIAQVTLQHRRFGEKEFHSVPMALVFRKSYQGVIPADAVKEGGIEFFVEAKDVAGEVVYAPKGYPSVTYSASIVPQPGPTIFVTQEGELPQVGKDYLVKAMVIGQPPGAKVRLRYRASGKGEYKSLPMRNMFYDSFQATVPGADVTAEGIEYLVEVEGEWWKKWTTPPNGEGSPFKVVPDMTPPGQVVGLKAEISGPYEVKLSWAEASDNVGVSCYEVYRGTFKGFAPVQERLIASTYKTTCYDIEVKAGQPYWYAVRAKDRAGSPGRPSVAALARIPTYPPPSPPAGVEATPGPGKIKISWNELALPVVGYNIYRAEAGASDKTLLNTRGLVRQSVYIDAGLKDKTNYTYTVRAVDRGGQESVASKPAAAMPLPRRESPVFAAHFENSPDAESGLKGNIEGSASYSAGVVGQALDLRSGGWLAFEHNDIFDISGELTLEAWVNFDSIDGMPVFLSHGQWRERGFFVQVLGGRIRFSLGGLNDLDAGRIEPGRWYHVVCTYDMKDMRVYINGREAGRRGAPDVDLNPWVGRLYIGRYTLSARPYEVSGLIDEVKIYQRSRTAQEIKNEYDSIASRLPR